MFLSRSVAFGLHAVLASEQKRLRKRWLPLRPPLANTAFNRQNVPLASFESKAQVAALANSQKWESFKRGFL